MRVLIIGGTFNPIHCGHLRIAIEATESLSCQRILWVPGQAPHYRPAADLLPYALRRELLDAALADLADGISAVLDDPERAYTYDTVGAIVASTPGIDPVFILGMDQFTRLPSWYRGAHLPALTDIAVAGRDGTDDAEFHRVVGSAWPEARRGPAPAGARAAYDLAGGRRVILLALPRLDISASLVRCRWVEGRSIRYLVPDAVLAVLERNCDRVTACWQAESR